MRSYTSSGPSSENTSSPTTPSIFAESSLLTASPLPRGGTAAPPDAKTMEQKVPLRAMSSFAQLDFQGIVRVDLTVPASALSKGRLLGKGAFGAVYEGVYEEGEGIYKKKKPVAIKELSPHLTEQAVKELKQEAEIMFHLGLESEYVVRLKKICLEPLHYSLVMELMPKGSLYGLLQNGQELPWTVRYQIALDAAWGLRRTVRAHQADHRTR
jgi:hypothetical protein